MDLLDINQLINGVCLLHWSYLVFFMVAELNDCLFVLLEFFWRLCLGLGCCLLCWQILAESSSSFRRYFFSSYFLVASIFCLYVGVVVSTAPQDCN